VPCLYLYVYAGRCNFGALARVTRAARQCRAPGLPDGRRCCEALLPACNLEPTRRQEGPARGRWAKLGEAPLPSFPRQLPDLIQFFCANSGSRQYLVGGQRCIYSHLESSIRRPISSHGLSLQLLRRTTSAGHPPVGMLAGRFDTTARLIAARPARVAPIARSLPDLLGSADSGHAPSLLCEPSTRRQTRQPKSKDSPA
jgi:hypothetical protein